MACKGSTPTACLYTEETDVLLLKGLQRDVTLKWSRYMSRRLRAAAERVLSLHWQAAHAHVDNLVWTWYGPAHHRSTRASNTTVGLPTKRRKGREWPIQGNRTPIGRQSDATKQTCRYSIYSP